MPLKTEHDLAEILAADPTWPDSAGMDWVEYLSLWGSVYKKGQFGRVMRDVADHLRRFPVVQSAKLPGPDLIVDALRTRAETAEAEVARLTDTLAQRLLDVDELCLIHEDYQRRLTTAAFAVRRAGRFRGRLRTAIAALSRIRNFECAPEVGDESSDTANIDFRWPQSIAQQELAFQEAETACEQRIMAEERTHIPDAPKAEQAR